MFINEDNNFVESIKELQGKKEFEEFVKSNLNLWNKTAEFMGYHNPTMVVAGNSSREDYCGFPVFFQNSIPEKCFKDGELNQSHPLFQDFMIEGNAITSWMPNFNPFQAYQLERKILEKGKYNIKETDYSKSKLGSMGFDKFGLNEIRINYDGSQYYEHLFAKGKTELEAICNAAIQFLDKDKYFRKTRSVGITDTTKHS